MAAPDSASHVPLGPGREFDLIRTLLREWNGLARGIGDDAAILDVPPGRLVASIDTMVDGVHFRREWLSLEEIGYRAGVAAVSDLAAMAATPLGMLIALTVPVTLVASAASIGDGLGQVARLADCPIVGGDTTRGDLLCLTIAVLGTAPHPVERSGARPGDSLYVTGRLGGPGAALAALTRGEPVSSALRDRFARPTPRLRESRWLAGQGATAMIDVSDGVASEVRHLAAASGVAVHVDLDALPCMPGIESRNAAASGEEFELLCTGGVLDAVEFERLFGLPLTRIGDVRAGAPGVEARAGGKRVDLPGGYDHFTQ
jgi:thiamine-monophosphate kinase